MDDIFDECVNMCNEFYDEVCKNPHYEFDLCVRESKKRNKLRISFKVKTDEGFRIKRTKFKVKHEGHLALLRRSFQYYTKLFRKPIADDADTEWRHKDRGKQIHE